MESAIIYTALLWTTALLVIVHKIGLKKIKEARVRKAMHGYFLLWPDGTRS